MSASSRPYPVGGKSRQNSWKDMRSLHFLHMAFGPADLDILRTALETWCEERGIALDSIGGELAASALVNMFREGHRTVPALVDALNRHKSLSSELAI